MCSLRDSNLSLVLIPNVNENLELHKKTGTILISDGGAAPSGAVCCCLSGFLAVVVNPVDAGRSTPKPSPLYDTGNPPRAGAGKVLFCVTSHEHLLCRLQYWKLVEFKIPGMSIQTFFNFFLETTVETY